MEIYDLIVGVLDDDRTVLNQCDKFLKKLNFGLIHLFEKTSDLLDFLERNESLHILFVDIRVPEISSLVAMQHIRLSHKLEYRNILFVPLLGRVSEDEVSYMGELDVLDFIPKPFEQHLFNKKIEKLVSLIKTEKNELNYWMLYNKLFFEKEYETAMKLAVQKIKEKPEVIKYHIWYLKILLANNNVDKAKNYAEKLIVTYYNHIPLINTLAQIELKMRNFEASLITFDKAQKISPLNIQRLITLGELHLASGRSALAEVKYRQALHMCKRSNVARIGLARTLIDQGKIDEANIIIGQSTDPTDVASFFNSRAILLVQNNNYEEAISMYEKSLNFLKDKSKRKAVLYNTALAYYKKGDYNAAFIYARQSLSCEIEFVKAKTLMEKLIKEHNVNAENLTKNDIPANIKTGMSQRTIIMTDDDIERLINNSFINISKV